MSANHVTDSQRFEAQTTAAVLDLWWGLVGLYRAFDQSGIAAMVEMDPGDLVRLAAPAVYGRDPDIEISGVLAGMAEESGVPASMFGPVLGFAAAAICKGRAEAAGG